MRLLPFTLLATALSTATFLLVGCGVALTAVQLAEADRTANSFGYRGKTYETRADAEAAAKAHIAALLKDIEALADPVAGRAQIIIPNKGGLLQRQARKIGGPEVNDYRATVGSEYLRMFAAAIERRNLFFKQEVVETSTPDHALPSADAATVYFYVSPGGEWTSWYYVSKTTPRTPLPLSEAPGTTRWLGAFLTNLEHVVRKDETK